MRSFENFVVFRYLLSSKQESFLRVMIVVAFLAVTLGNMVLVSVVSIMNGFQKEIRRLLIVERPHLIIYGNEENLKKLHDNLTLSEVVSKELSYQAPALVVGRVSSTGVIIKGKQLNDKSSQDVIKLPGRVAFSIGAQPGDVVKVLSASSTITPLGSLPRSKSLIYEPSEHEEEFVGIIDYNRGRDLLRPNTYILELRVKDPDKANLTKITLERQILANGFLASVQSWIDINEPLWNALQLEKTAYFIVLTLIIVVASFSVLSTLILFVIEKRKELAIFNALGASVGNAQRIFIKLGAVIGGLGTLVGLGLGFVFCLGLDYYGFPLDQRVFGISKLPVEFKLTNYLIVGLVSIIICLISTIYPVRRVAHLKSSRILRE